MTIGQGKLCKWPGTSNLGSEACAGLDKWVATGKLELHAGEIWSRQIQTSGWESAILGSAGLRNSPQVKASSWERAILYSEQKLLLGYTV